MCLAKDHTVTDGIAACDCFGPVPVVQLPGHQGSIIYLKKFSGPLDLLKDSCLYPYSRHWSQFSHPRRVDGSISGTFMGKLNVKCKCWIPTSPFQFFVLHSLPDVLALSFHVASHVSFHKTKGQLVVFLSLFFPKTDLLKKGGMRGEWHPTRNPKILGFLVQGCW